MAGSNWNEVRQSIVNDIASFTDDFLVKASNDIKVKLEGKGVPKGKLTVSFNKKRIFMETTIEDEYEEGKAYFEQVYDEVSDPGWPETIK